MDTVVPLEKRACLEALAPNFGPALAAVLLSCSIFLNGAYGDCPRVKSKIIRRIVTQVIFPIYSELEVQIPVSCPLSPGRDVYNYQEEVKHMESPTKWVCQLCGKAFYEERHLDAHLDARHPDSRLQNAGTICLANYCDVFRCSVHEMRSTPDHWDLALCQEAEFEKYRERCLKLLSTCVPKDISPLKQKLFTAKFNASLCSYLTCENYWTLYADDASALSTAVYILIFVILVFGLVFYYIMVSQQLPKSKEMVQRLEEDGGGLDGQPRHRQPPFDPWKHSDLRQRPAAGFS